MKNLLHGKCAERERELMERIGEEVEKQECLDRELLNRRVRMLTDEIDRLKSPNSWLVDPESVFSISKTGLIMLNGAQITDRELKNLKSEVRALRDFELFKVLQNTLRQKAVEKALLSSTDLYSLKGNEQVLAGKMMIWSLDIIKTIVNDIDKAKTK